MLFEFATAGRICFGAGVVKKVPEMVGGMGKRVLLLTGGTEERSRHLADGLEAAGITVTRFAVRGEPVTDTVDRAAALSRKAECTFVIAMGGGSVVDTGKAAAALAANPGEIMDYLEVVGRGQPLAQPSLPCVAIPTTAGTGAEVTRNAVLGSPRHGLKVSMRSPFMLPTLAVIDPELTLSLPPGITASTGLDALTQLLEAFVSPLGNPLTDALCREGLVRSARSLEAAVENGRNLEARTDLSLASLLSGMALANAKLGAVHGLAAPIGGMFPAPHGAVCAALLAHVTAANVAHLRRHDPNGRPLSQYARFAGLVTGEPDPGRGVSWLREICAALHCPTLGALGIDPGAFQILAARARNASSMRGNPVEMTEEMLVEILTAAS